MDSDQVSTVLVIACGFVVLLGLILCIEYALNWRENRQMRKDRKLPRFSEPQSWHGPRPQDRPRYYDDAIWPDGELEWNWPERSS